MTGRSSAGVTILTAQDVHAMGPAAVTAQIRNIIGDGPAYLSFDIDVLDPAFAPGTGTPEIGGLASWQVQAILRSLGGIAFVGMDVVEVAPAYDVAEITALAGATVAWEYLCLRGWEAATGFTRNHRFIVVTSLYLSPWERHRGRNLIAPRLRPRRVPARPAARRIGPSRRWSPR